jgi:hypothetical protein
MTWVTRFARGGALAIALATWLGVVNAGRAAAAGPWDGDVAVQEVLRMSAEGIAAISSTGPTAESERYSSTFVANAPANTLVSGRAMPQNFGHGFRYQAVEQRLDYAGSHGPDVVVVMGEEVVVPGPGAPKAGRRVHRRFTDVFRKENGEWRDDLRRANVTGIEGE